MGGWIRKDKFDAAKSSNYLKRLNNPLAKTFENNITDLTFREKDGENVDEYDEYDTGFNGRQHWCRICEGNGWIYRGSAFGIRWGRFANQWKLCPIEQCQFRQRYQVEQLIKDDPE